MRFLAPLIFTCAICGESDEPYAKITVKITEPINRAMMDVGSTLNMIAEPINSIDHISKVECLLNDELIKIDILPPCIREIPHFKYVLYVWCQELRDKVKENLGD